MLFRSKSASKKFGISATAEETKSILKNGKSMKNAKDKNGKNKSKSALDFLPFIRYNISTGTPQDGSLRYN